MEHGEWAMRRKKRKIWTWNEKNEKQKRNWKKESKESGKGNKELTIWRRRNTRTDIKTGYIRT